MTLHRILGSALSAAGGLAILAFTVLLYTRDSAASPSFQALLRIGVAGLLLMALGGASALGFGLWLAASPGDGAAPALPHGPGGFLDED